jgi:hypothetical protein
LRQLLPGLLVWIPLASAGIYPALVLNLGVDPATITDANRIYVFERLPHHLLLTRMRWDFVVRFVVLACILAVASIWIVRTPRQRRLRAIVGTTTVFSLIGAALSVVAEYRPDAAAALLRFYWFRLADVAVPIAAALMAVLAILRLNRTRPIAAAGLLLIAIVACSAHLGITVLTRFQEPYPLADKPGKVVDYADWRAICEWVVESGEIPSGARFLTPRNGQTFKWYTGHPEVVTWKDMPQDAPHLVEWFGRLEEIHKSRSGDPLERWADSLSEIGAAELIRLGHKYDARYVLTEAEPSLPLERIVWNTSYVVYRLPEKEKQ